ncbi:hypothetical protein J2W28_005037 [Variovorax boronicumulans]|uniref:DUF4194 domain-containing protein n=1 Tax=Variovorax boronicumulans TaxID=436515 RepID=UPI002780B0D9|nr:DUF4194 domain-containing protein [Variovorax boronicumulans]MDP9994433.1 hypothetical protein [Variovorax boronicumulans]MDQ0005868.1 hypothetical protein [Variovorax boronicumulans]MDQ0044491.1 hypothetical protein [Variovorax boronicumulans]
MHYNSESAPSEHRSTADDSFEASVIALQTTRREAFEGDSGALPLDTRRTLVQILTGPLIDGRRHTKAWEVVLRDEVVLRSRLHELFLELVLDRDQQVAFLRQIVREDVDIPILLRRNTLSFIETALLLFLRLRLTQAEAQGERAVVDLLAMLEYLKTFERSDNVDQSRFAKNCDSAVEKAKKLNLLRKLANSEDRFEVSPALKLLFPAEEIEQLTKAYEAAAKLSNAPDVGADESGAVDGENDEGWSQT